MNQIIKSYSDLSIGPLQKMRLYAQGRPLLPLARKKHRNRPLNEPKSVIKISEILPPHFVSVDCAGWYFNTDQRQCWAVEIHPESKKFYKKVFIEYDYLTCSPSYLSASTVLAYYPSYLKYSTIDELLKFCNTWGDAHKALILCLDPTKIKFNYLKYCLTDILGGNLSFSHTMDILIDDPFELLIMIKKI